MLLLFSLISISFVAMAQQQYFLYFESAEQHPFYIKMGDKVYSSIAPGYYILPSLTEGKYQLAMGMPGEGAKERKFEIDIRGDKGYIIKQQNSRIILANLDDNREVAPLEDISRSDITYETRTDAFTLLLSRASGDPGLVMMPVFAKNVVAQKKEVAVTAVQVETPKEVNADPVVVDTVAYVQAEQTTDTVTVIKAIIETEAEKKEEAQVVEVEQPEKIQKDTASGETVAPAEQMVPEPGALNNRTGVRKYAERSSTEGFIMVFLDETPEGTDTIRMVIPNPRFRLMETDTQVKDESLFLDVKREVPIAEDKKPETTSTLNKEDTTVLQNPSTIQEPAVSRNQCRQIASESDFFKLRKNMAGKLTDEAMVEEARKVFRSRCFSTDQVRHLGALFLTSAGKYLFFDAAYLHISDPAQFPSLQAEISDDYYLRRFKALIGEF